MNQLPGGKALETPTKKPAHNESYYENLASLLHGSMQMHAGEIELSEWLRRLTLLADCDGAASLRWTRGKPANCIMSSHGNVPELCTLSLSLLDRLITQSNRREPDFIQGFLGSSDAAANALPEIAHDPRCLLAVVDWSPACIVVVLQRDAHKPAWSSADRQRLADILPYVRDSVRVHKLLDQHRYIAGLARDLLDKSPRGILLLSEDGVIQLANARANAILADRDGISESNGRLVIHCKVVAERVKNYLQEMGNDDSNGVPEMDWNMAAQKLSGLAPYQVILGYLKLADWNIESRHSDRVAVMHLHDPDMSIGVSAEKLQDFYGFTKAQARLAAKLFQGHTINEAARLLNISVNTARTHVRGIYAKTGVNSQAELLGLLSAGLTSYGQNLDDGQSG